jgi:hypothetical protein
LPIRYSLQIFAYRNAGLHTADVCNLKQRLLDQLRTQQAAPVSLVASTAAPAAAAAVSDSKTSDEDFAYSFPLTTSHAATHCWVLDSGATCCATFDEADCIDIRPCSVQVTAAGSTFTVNRVGTAVISTIDELGRSVELKMKNTLISPKFPYKLLALRLFTLKGYLIVMTEHRIRITSPACDSVFVGLKDATTQLFFLQETAQQALLARSYGTGKSDLDLLWKLHLRHGHRNFADLGRQYGLAVPKEIPACTSCIMGKSHVHPHLSTGFERASRIAEGFHSDLRPLFCCNSTRFVVLAHHH